MANGIKFTEAKLEGGWLMLKPTREDMGKAMAFVRNLKKTIYEATLKVFRKKRSNDANALAWEIIGKIADFLRVPPVVVYRQAILSVPDNYEILQVRECAYKKFKENWEAQGLGWPCVLLGRADKPDYVNVQAYYGSSTYDTRQFSILIDVLIQDAQALGIEVRPDEEIRSLLESVR